jgi:predicted HTH transcriptional regulator
MMVELSDADLIARMRNFEDQFVERKVCSDSKDWVKTVVAFANSAPVDYPCILYIGVRDTGEIEDKQANLDSVQKTLNRMLQDAYPRVPVLPKIITDDSKQALAVIVPGSALRPHFAGPSYVRIGSETFEASASQMETMIASRSGKVYKLSKYIGELVSVDNLSMVHNGLFQRTKWPDLALILDCNEFWVTLQQKTSGAKFSFVLKDVDLNWDHQNDRLHLDIIRREY